MLAALFVLALGLASLPVSGATTLTAAASETKETSAVITWSMTQDLCFTHYEVQHREAGQADWITDTSINNSSVLRYTLTGLLPGRNYEARINDVDCAGGQPSNTVAFTTPKGLPGFDLVVTLGAVSVAFVLAARRSTRRQE